MRKKNEGLKTKNFFCVKSEKKFLWLLYFRCYYLSFKVTKQATANTIPIIQKRVTILASW